MPMGSGTNWQEKQKTHLFVVFTPTLALDKTLMAYLSSISDWTSHWAVLVPFLLSCWTGHKHPELFSNDYET